jgi:hypothetical protein
MNGKLLDACALLLGLQVRVKGASILQQLDVAPVRRAYRVMAVATHPDAARRRLIGRYFVEKQIMAGDVLIDIIRELYRHNARYGKEG